MANYFATKTAQFKPFSYQEMLAPIKAYQDAYNEANEKLDLLLEDAATKAFNFASQDTVEKEAYDAIMSKLKTASDSLNAGDVNAFKNIKDVNKEYRKIMLPIQKQLEKRAELIAEQRKYAQLNPNLRFSTDYSKANLSDITASSTYDIYDLNTITKDVKEEMSDFIKGMPRTDFEPIPIGKTSNVLVKTGYGYDANEFEEQMKNTNSALYKLYKSKIDNLNPNMPKAIKKEAEKEIYNTMKANAGLFKFDTVIDYSTKPSGNNKPGGKGSKPQIYGEVKVGDKFTSIIYNGKMMTAEIEWFKNEKGEDVYRIKPETIRGISNADKDKAATKEDIQITMQTFMDDEGAVVKTVKTEKGSASAFGAGGEGTSAVSDSTAVAGSVGNKGLKGRKK